MSAPCSWCGSGAHGAEDCPNAPENDGADRSAAKPPERTLILEIALPDFNCEDYRLDGPDPYMNEALAEMLEDTGGEPTPEWFGWQALDDSGLTTSRVNLSILLILGRWSMSGLRYIKEKAWKLAAA